MGKIKKVLLNVLILSMMFSVGVNAENADKEAPVLKSVLVVSSVDGYEAGDTITVNITATDNLSGLSRVGLHWKLDGTDGSGINSYEDSYTVNSNECSINFQVPGNMLSGKWILSHMMLWDNAGNLQEYDISDSAQLAGAAFQIKNDTGDFDAPKLNSISISPNTGVSETTRFFIQASISDLQSGVNDVQLTYFYGAVGNESFKLDLKLNQSTGQYEAEYYAPKNLKSRVLILGYIRISDKAGNTIYYSDRETEVQDKFGINCTHFDTNLDITLEDIVEDNDLPTLTGFKWETSSLYTPGEAKLIVHAADKTSGINNIEVSLTDSSGNKAFNMAYFRLMDKDPSVSKSKFELSHSFSKYAKSDKYRVYSIKITDNAGNSNYYCIDSESIENKINVKEINVHNANQAEIFLSTSDADYIDKIAKVEEGRIVVVDTAQNSVISKKLFDAIKGKDITVVFEKAFGNEWDMQGIQWVINGLDIQNETKDIDVNVFIERVDVADWVEQREKKYGSKLPQLQVEGSTIEETDRLLKELLIQKGWGDIIAEVEASQKEGESFNDTLARLSTETTSHLKIVFADNGVLPCITNIRLNVGYATRNIVGVNNLNLYYLNEIENKYELVQKSVGTEKDGYYELTITHNSTYALTSQNWGSEGIDSNIPEVPDKTKAEKLNSGQAQGVKTGDNSNGGLFGALSIGSLLTAAIIVINKRKRIC